MIDSDHFGFTVICDQCGHEKHFDIDHEDWSGLMQAMREAGWTKLKVEGLDNEWEHYCPECSG